MRLIAPLFLALAFFLSFGSGPLTAQNGLFTPLTIEPDLPFNRWPATATRQRLVRINLDQLRPPAKAPAQEAGFEPVYLNLFDDVSLTTRLNPPERTPSGGRLWVGTIEGVPHSEVTLVLEEEVLSGNITVPGAFYQVRLVGDRVHAVREIDQRVFPPEKDPIPVPFIDVRSSEINQAIGLAYRTYLPLVKKDRQDPFLEARVLVVYTPAARTAAGGTTAMTSLINLAVSETNTGYANSGVGLRVRLAHAAEVAYDETNFDWNSTLDRLTGTSDGYLDGVHGVRDSVQADLVVLLVGNQTFCGIGWLMKSPSSSFSSHAFTLVNWECATGYYSFAHEMGHNMGSHHDWNNTVEPGCYAYSKGYQDPNRLFRTIMAYNCPGSCPRINYWSNPDVYYLGQPTGVPYDAFRPADNRRSLNNTASTVTGWR